MWYRAKIVEVSGSILQVSLIVLGEGGRAFVYLNRYVLKKANNPVL